MFIILLLLREAQRSRDTKVVALHMEQNNMAGLRHIGTIESDEEIEDFESEDSVQENENVEWFLLLFFPLFLE